MGKSLKILGANFATNAIGTVTPSAVSAPTITISSAGQVTISATSGADVYYTTNGNTPTSSSTKYTSSFTVADGTTVKAIAILAGDSSNVSTKTFVIPFTKLTWRQLTDSASGKISVISNTEIPVGAKLGFKSGSNGKYFYKADGTKQDGFGVAVSNETATNYTPATFDTSYTGTNYLNADITVTTTIHTIYAWYGENGAKTQETTVAQIEDIFGIIG